MAWTIATIIVGVLTSTVLLYYVGSLAWKAADRANVDARYRRRSLVFVGMIYVVCGTVVIAEVVTGREPLEALFGLPIGAILAWFWIRSGIKTKVPPEQ